MMSKQVNSADDLIHFIRNGMTIMAGGFGLCGIPENMINAVAASNVIDLTVISNNIGIDNFGLGKWLSKRQIKKILASYVGENKEFENMLLKGEVEMEFVPQGTLAERIRAGGAGIPAFYVATGVGTEVAEGKEERVFDGQRYILEKALRADVALVKAWKGDEAGNLVFKDTAQNFNAAMAMAGKLTIAEVEEMVPIGSLDPNHIHVPGIFVQYIFEGSNYEKRIERLTLANQV
ncbi:CoA transferase subunit A [Carboxylicivirga sp. N1Y90]|uniref:CoA transferase subunit A n=1 Tax=Carboxylicivirga fragile TaxID=3417571 RepID=UPI003D359926|nr:CoA transferase subunit A [Marinilabiliaceae bacterium N1Y90]